MNDIDRCLEILYDMISRIELGKEKPASVVFYELLYKGNDYFGLMSTSMISAYMLLPDVNDAKYLIDASVELNILKNEICKILPK